MSEFIHIISLEWQVWLAKTSIIIAITFGISLIVDHFLEFVENKLNNRAVWNRLLIEVIRLPVKVLIWLFGIILMIKAINLRFSQVELANELHIARNLGIILCLGWSQWRFVKKYEEHIIHAGNIGKIAGTINVTSILKFLKILIIVLLILMVMQTLGVSVNGLIAFGGVGGLVVGFAAKDLLANFFGAAMISFDYPFSVGDWVRSPDRQIEGIVEHIGLRLTNIRTFDKRVLYVPNSIFSNIIVENPSRMTNRRIFENIRLRYNDFDKVEKIMSDIKELLAGNKDIEENPMVNLNELGESSINFFIEAFTRTTDWREYSSIKEQVLLKIYSIIRENNAEIMSINYQFQPRK